VRKGKGGKSRTLLAHAASPAALSWSHLGGSLRGTSAALLAGRNAGRQFTLGCSRDTGGGGALGSHPLTISGGPGG
jgi:hypothetical protein